MFIEAQIRPSRIFGQGLFTAQPVPKGTILCFFSTEARVITESQYLDHIRRGTPDVTRTGTRLGGRYFAWTADTTAKLNYFNHSFQPNCLVHCGIVLALADLPPGTELTIDYRTLIDSTDIGIYNDATTGQEIRGFDARHTLLTTARQLIALLEDLPDWTG